MRSLLSAALTIISVSLAAGSLTPPAGPVAPTMKTLDQVEPRAAITSASLPMHIDAPGSYYVVENIDYSADNSLAILITSSDVTIDLNGFVLSTQSQSTCIQSGSASNNIVVKNGTLRGWSRSLNLQGNHSRVLNVYVENSDQLGINIRSGEVRNCIVRSCGYGINARGGNDMPPITISDCHVYDATTYGIRATSPSRINGNIVVRSGTVGIEAGGGSRQSVISGNSCYDNGTTGIVVRAESCRVMDNLISDTPEGIYVRALAPHVENNTVTLCNIGIRTEINGYVIRNSSTYTSFDYRFSPDTNHGPIVRLTGGVMPSDTSPLANIIFD